MYYVYIVAFRYVNPLKNSQQIACSVGLCWLQKIKVMLSDILVYSLWSTACGKLVCLHHFFSEKFYSPDRNS